MMEEQITPGVTLAQACASHSARMYGIVNIPNEHQYGNIKALCLHVVEPVYGKFGRVGHSSMFRCKQLNTKVGGSVTSDHTAEIGAAVDLVSGIICTNADIFHFIKDNLQFDQLIWEFGTDANPAWVHVGYRSTGNRKMILKSTKVNGKTIYTAI
jgi:hypothetical protein